MVRHEKASDELPRPFPLESPLNQLETLQLTRRKAQRQLKGDMSALFNFQSLLLVILLFICTCTYVRATAPGLVDRNKQGFFGLFFKFARIGERLSPYVSLACIIMAFTILIGN